MASLVVNRGIDARSLGVVLPDEFAEVVLAVLRAGDEERAEVERKAHDEAVWASLHARLTAGG